MTGPDSTSPPERWSCLMAGAVAGAFVGLCVVRGGPLSGAASVWALWTAYGLAGGALVEVLCSLAGLGAVFYGARERGVASVLLVASMTPAALELSARPWAERVPGGGLLAWPAVALIVVVGAFVLAWCVAGRVDRRAGWVILAAVAVMPLVTPAGLLNPMPVVRLTLCAALLVAGTSAIARGALISRRMMIGGATSAVLLAVVVLYTAGPAAPTTREHVFTSTLRAPFIDATGQSSEEARRLVARFFGRSVSGRGGELARLLPDRRLNVVWITTCTFRHDRLGRAALTPHLDALAARSRVFEHAWTPYPASAQASEAMFSGRYVSASDGWRKKLGLTPLPGQAWVPSVVDDAGYATWAYTSLGMVAESEDFRTLFTGFDVADSASQTDHRADVDTVRAFTDKLATHAGGTPFFSWLFLMDSHAPYDGDPENPDPDATVQERYDAEIRIVDREVGRVLAALESRGVADRTIVIVHADHGEAFGEHGASYHGSSVYEEQARIPLLIHVPGLPAGRSRTPVDLTDLAPTVLELLDLPGAGGLGDSLVPVLLGDEIESAACAEMFVLGAPSAAQRMIVGADLVKVIRHGTGTSAVYDLTDDPKEAAPRASTARGDELADLLSSRMQVSVSGATLNRKAALPGPATESLPAHVEKAFAALESGNVNSLAFGLAHAWQPLRTLALVRSLVTHANAGVRLMAVNHLSQFGAASDADALRAAMADPSPRVRAAAARALWEVLGEDARAELLETRGVHLADAVQRATVVAHAEQDPAALRPLLSRLHGMSPIAADRFLAALGALGDADTLALAEAVARSPRAAMIDRWRGLGMLFGAGLPTAGPIGVQLLRRAPPPDALLTHALQLAPDDPRPVAPILLEIVERYSPKLAWDAYQVLLRGWPADELADLIHAWQDLRAGVGGAADRVKACGVDPCVVTDVPVAFDDAPQLTVDRPWPTQPTNWAVPALRVTVRGVAAPVRLRLRAGWAIAGAEDVGGQIVDVVIAGEARVVVPLPAVAPGRTVSGTWIELLSADGRSRRL